MDYIYTEFKFDNYELVLEINLFSLAHKCGTQTGKVVSLTSLKMYSRMPNYIGSGIV